LPPQLSPVEVGFYNYSSALADWLGPHHDFCRPPPAEVLAKANKITQQKTGHSLKGYDPVTASNDTSNGDSKREEDAPVVKDAPAITFEFFDSKLCVI
jgi:N-terminal acetyltransferase B complex non-catalytic subunit